MFVRIKRILELKMIFIENLPLNKNGFLMSAQTATVSQNPSSFNPFLINHLNSYRSVTGQQKQKEISSIEAIILTFPLLEL